MADMFGAPVGISKAREDIAQSELSNARIQELMGKIAMQPTEQAMHAAHAQYWQAEAEAKRAAIEESRGISTLLGQGMAAGTGSAESGADSSAAVPIERMANILGGNNPSGKILYKPFVALTKDAVGIRLKEQQRDAAAASEQLRQVNAQIKRNQIIGGIMGSITDQASYDRARLMGADSGIDISQYPPTYEQARPMIAQVAQLSMSRNEQLMRQQRDTELRLMTTRTNAITQRNNAVIPVLKARATLLDQQIAEREKNGGKDSPEVVELRKQRARLAAAQADKLEAANAPLLTPDQVKDPAKRKVGQAYRTPQGILTWTGEGWMQAPTRAAGPQAAPAAGSDDDLEDDDLED